MADPLDDSAQPPPNGVSVEQRDEYLRIDRRWLSRSAVILAGVAVAWNGFVIYLYGFADPAPAAEPGPHRLLPPLLMAVGLLLVYAALARCLNRTTIELLPHRGATAGPPPRTLRIRHRPMPWIGNPQIDTAEIERLYLQTHRSESSRIRGRFGTRHTYSINARTRGGDTRRLVSSIEQPHHAGFIIRRLERALGLDRHRRRPGG